MAEIITLYELTPQEEIFCQHYNKSVNAAIAAFNAGFLEMNIEYKRFNDVPVVDIKKLRRSGNSCLKKNIVKRRISEIAKEEAEKSNIVSLDETLEFLSCVIRDSKQDLENTYKSNAAIRAAELVLKRYPVENIEKSKDVVQFARR